MPDSTPIQESHQNGSKTTESRFTETTNDDAVNIVLGPKGNMGKSLVSAIIAEFLRKAGREVDVYDADPAQKTLARRKALGVTAIDILTRNEHDEIALDILSMDALFSDMLETENSVVFDCGASGYERVISFFMSRLDDGKTFIKRLADTRRTIVHSIVVGADNHIDTAKALEWIIDTFPENVEKVVWLNPHFGPLEHRGMSFEQSRLMIEKGCSLSGIVRMPLVSPVFAAPYFKQMTLDALTFGEVFSSKDKKIWPATAKLRMRNLWDPLAQQLAEIL